MKIVCVIILLIQINFQGFAQRDYYPGFVVTNMGDTISGRVMDRKSTPFRLLRKIRFIDENNKKYRYTTGEILSYKIGDNLFESHWHHGKRRFFKVMERGYATYFELESTDEYDGLSGTKYLKRPNETQFTMVIMIGFRIKMMKYFADCKELVRSIDLKEFRYRNLAQVVRFYNNQCDVPDY